MITKNKLNQLLYCELGIGQRLLECPMCEEITNHNVSNNKETAYCDVCGWASSNMRMI